MYFEVSVILMTLWDFALTTITITFYFWSQIWARMSQEEDRIAQFESLFEFYRRNLAPDSLYLKNIQFVSKKEDTRCCLCFCV